jgi:hypothetical protein
VAEREDLTSNILRPLTVTAHQRPRPVSMDRRQRHCLPGGLLMPRELVAREEPVPTLRTTSTAMLRTPLRSACTA